jgi:hypothetical protein
MLPTTTGNIFGTPVVEELSVPSHFFWISLISSNLLTFNADFTSGNSPSHSESNQGNRVGVPFQ